TPLVSRFATTIPPTHGGPDQVRCDKSPSTSGATFRGPPTTASARRTRPSSGSRPGESSDPVLHRVAQRWLWGPHRADLGDGSDNSAPLDHREGCASRAAKPTPAASAEARLPPHLPAAL